MMHWTLRQHAARVSTRFYSGGWEFETADGAREYISQQFAKYPAADLQLAPFQATVQSEGVSASFYCSEYGCNVRTGTHRKGETMRDLVTVASPSDCFWMVPGMNQDGWL